MEENKVSGEEGVSDILQLPRERHQFWIPQRDGSFWLGAYAQPRREVRSLGPCLSATIQPLKIHNHSAKSLGRESVLWVIAPA